MRFLSNAREAESENPVQSMFGTGSAHALHCKRLLARIELGLSLIHIYGAEETRGAVRSGRRPAKGFPAGGNASAPFPFENKIHGEMALLP